MTQPQAAPFLPHLAAYASHHSDSRGRLKANLEKGAPKEDAAPDSRTPFQRDRDRIIHCSAFRRLKHKTQVFLYHEGDHFRTRLTHSIEVAQITRAICRQLCLDDDLGEAIALAHDLGHTPFGHAGETVLKEAMQAVGGFDHNEQTVRVVTQLEQCYIGFDGLNLTWEVLEGIIKHNGPEANPRPTIKALDEAFDFGLGHFASLEAQAAGLSDDIAYLAHDCADAVRAGVLEVEEMAEVPLAGGVIKEIRSELKAARYAGQEMSRLVHELTRRLIGLAVADLVAESARRIEQHKPGSVDDVRQAERGLVGFSDAMSQDLEALRGFLFKHVYRHYKVNRMTSTAKRVMRGLYDLFMEQINILPPEWQSVGGVGLADLGEEVRARRVADYLAGMTDRYAMMEYERLFALSPILR